MSRLNYLARSLATQFSKARFKCPNCDIDAPPAAVDRKYVITQLRRCPSCMLMYRTPTDDPNANATFYENEYAQGFTTEMPSDDRLAEQMRTNFAGTEKDYSYYIGVLTTLGLSPSGRIFDYGCSWGYGSYQLTKAGFDVVSFEVAPSRRNFAREKLGVKVLNDMNEARPGFDCFFSAHVLEHVPSPAASFRSALNLLKPGGLFVSFTPNGSFAYRSASSNWRKLWGEVHPNFIDDVFLNTSFKSSPRVIGSSPLGEVAIPATSGVRQVNRLDGDELFFAARKIGSSWN
jgi:2-polyprenyl-3-methyl-5-hydroxy-6-metoxy-1,4-benzoquinol methylase